MKPIFVDIETSGISKVKNGFWQIGAIDLSNPSNYFLEEGRVDNEDIIEEGALKVTGKTEAQLRDQNKQTQQQLLQNFFDWVLNSNNGVKMKNLASQNPNFDFGFIDFKSEKYKIRKPFHYRYFDLHSIAQTVYHSAKGNFLLAKDNDYSCMDLSHILDFCGIEDKRKQHNALEDSRLGRECFSRLIDGKNLFLEYLDSPIPDYLKK